MPRAEPPTATVLVVDDDVRMRHLMQVVLESAGFGVECADDGDVVLSTVRRARPDVLLLDMKMPRVSGLQALRELRSAGEDVPVLMLSAMAEEQQMLAAFDAGADDYVTKPFLPQVVVARLRALLRRARSSGRKRGKRFGGVALDPKTREALVNGKRIRLSPTEYTLLRTLMRGDGRVFTTDELLAAVWGESYVGQDDIVRANIYRLRRKVEPRPNAPRFIRGQRGVGYRFEPAVT
jgi:DNA-binding response OmpR family regulator